jgi:head-tail adaptor
MAFAELLVDTFIPQTKTITDDGTVGRTEIWTDGDSFLGRLSSVSVRESITNKLVSASLLSSVAVYSSHRLFCLGTVTLTEQQRVKLGTRTFEIKGVNNPSNIDHHKEVDLLEVI